MSSKSETIVQTSEMVATQKKSITEDSGNKNNGIENKKVKIEHPMESVEIEAKKFNEAKKLSNEILKRFHCEPGKLLIAGNVDWEATGKKNLPRNELNVFHSFTDEKVTPNEYCLNLTFNIKYSISMSFFVSKPKVSRGCQRFIVCSQFIN